MSYLYIFGNSRHFSSPKSNTRQLKDTALAHTLRIRSAKETEEIKTFSYKKESMGSFIAIESLLFKRTVC